MSLSVSLAKSLQRVNAVWFPIKLDNRIRPRGVGRHFALISLSSRAPVVAAMSCAAVCWELCWCGERDGGACGGIDGWMVSLICFFHLKCVFNVRKLYYLGLQTPIDSLNMRRNRHLILHGSKWEVQSIYISFQALGSAMGRLRTAALRDDRGLHRCNLSDGCCADLPPLRASPIRIRVTTDQDRRAGETVCFVCHWSYVSRDTVFSLAQFQWLWNKMICDIPMVCLRVYSCRD